MNVMKTLIVFVRCNNKSWHRLYFLKKFLCCIFVSISLSNQVQAHVVVDCKISQMRFLTYLHWQVLQHYKVMLNASIKLFAIQDKIITVVSLKHTKEVSKLSFKIQSINLSEMIRVDQL